MSYPSRSPTENISCSTVPIEAVKGSKTLSSFLPPFALEALRGLSYTDVFPLSLQGSEHDS